VPQKMRPRVAQGEHRRRPRPGGIYRCVVNDSSRVVGAYVEVDPPHRVAFTWGFEESSLFLRRDKSQAKQNPNATAKSNPGNPEISSDLHEAQRSM